MKLSDQIKPISYLKAHAAEILRNLSTQMEPLVITQNGEAKAVMQDIKSYEQTQETKTLWGQVFHRAEIGLVSSSKCNRPRFKKY